MPLLVLALADGPPLQMVEADGEVSRQQLMAPPGEDDALLIPAPPGEVTMLAPTHRKEMHSALLLAQTLADMSAPPMVEVDGEVCRQQLQALPTPGVHLAPGLPLDMEQHSPLASMISSTWTP